MKARKSFRPNRLRLLPFHDALEERQLLSVGATPASATFLQQDATTQGNWVGTYGSQGYDVIGAQPSLPSYASITPSANGNWTWAWNTTDPRALQIPGGGGTIAACWYSPASFTVDVNLTDGQIHDLELYLVDWDSTSRAEQVQISDANTGAVLSTQSVSGFHNGVYLNYAVSGDIRISFANQGGPNAVLSGLFFDPQGGASEIVRPAVTSEGPAAGATGIATNTPVTATFNRSVQSSTINTNDFLLTAPGGQAVPATVSYNPVTETATLTPSSPLANSTTYTATIQGVQTSTGIAMAAPFSWSFTTMGPPVVTGETPASGTTEVSISATTTATFNEPVQPSTIGFQLRNTITGATVPATTSYNPSTLVVTLTPNAPLAFSTNYTATISGVRDLAGDLISAPVSWSFTSVPPEGPLVTAESPVAGALGVMLASPIQATFSEPVQAGTIRFTLSDNFGDQIPGVVSYNASTGTATFTPSAPLAASRAYTVTVSGATDLNGLAMQVPATWQFITDPGPATVTAETPVSGGTTQGTAPSISATFSEPVQAGTIGFSLADASGHPVAATVSYNPANLTVTLLPSTPLATSTTYTATVSAAQDLAGDPLAVPFTWSFTTAAAPSLQSGLVAEWNFNEGSGTTTADSTGNGHTGTLSGAVTWTSGQVGPHALSFSAAGQGHVTVPDSTSLTFTTAQSFTLSAWVDVPSLSNWWEGVVTKVNYSGSGTSDYGIWINAAHQWDAPGTSTDLIGPTVSLGWSNVVLSQDGTTGTRSLYVNGVQVASGPAQASNLAGPLWIGGDANVSDYFTGTIDDVRLYNRALSGAEVLSLTTTAAPAVIAETPTVNATGAETVPTLTANFSQPVQSGTIHFTLTSSSGVSVPGTVSYNSAGNAAVFTPGAILAYGTTYTATVYGAQNSAGTAQDAPFSWSFTTAAAPGFAPGAVTGEYLVTDAGTIPNYGYNPTVVSVANGSWSSGSTWSTGQVPGAGAVVSIAPGTTVTYDANSTTVLDAITIQAGGTLQFATNVTTEMISANYLVLPGGTLTVGTKANPIAPNVTATIETANQAINTAFDPSQFGDSLIGMGNVTMYGAAKTPFVQLAVAPVAGATTLYLSQPVTGWQVGDVLFLPDTRQLDTTNDPQYGVYVPEQETPTIASISANGLVVTLASPLKYSHPGGYDSNGNLTFLPQVVDETRNVAVRSQDQAGNRGIVMFLQNANVDIHSAAFLGLGRTIDTAFDNTTFDSSGQVTHVGTNQQDRTPVQFLDLWGPASPQADGYQFTFADSVVHCIMEIQDHIWGIEVNNSSYGLIQGNFVDNWYGAGISLVSGTEVHNMIEGNFVAEINGTGQNDATGLDGLGYWSRTPNDSWVNNVATDINPGGLYSYGYDINALYVGANGFVPVPAYQGADPTQPGQSLSIDVNATPILQFSGNETYGATPNALSTWWLGSFGGTARGVGGVFRNLYAWNISGWGLYGYTENDVTFDGFFMRVSTDVNDDGSTGMMFSDYQQSGFVLDNADIQGVLRGIQAPEMCVGEMLIENSYISAVTDVAVAPSASVNDPSGAFGKSLVLQDDVFAAPSGYAVTAVAMEYYAFGGFPGSAMINLILPDQVFIYNYDRISGDNLQVYYTQQAASFIMPQSGSTNGLIASPVSGLTNAQNWATYGIAVADAVAPSSATSMAGFIGLVVSLGSLSSTAMVASGSGGQSTTSGNAGANVSVLSASTPLAVQTASSPLMTTGTPAAPSAPSASPSASPLLLASPAPTSSQSSAVPPASPRKSSSTIRKPVAGPLVLMAAGRKQVRQLQLAPDRPSKTASGLE